MVEVIRQGKNAVQTVAELGSPRAAAIRRIEIQVDGQYPPRRSPLGQPPGILDRWMAHVPVPVPDSGRSNPC